MDFVVSFRLLFYFPKSRPRLYVNEHYIKSSRNDRFVITYIFKSFKGFCHFTIDDFTYKFTFEPS
jgi:hypothetical protein